MPRLILNPDVFQDPNMVGQSEYLAIYETVERALEEETPEAIENLIQGILENFIEMANGLLADLKTKPATVTDPDEEPEEE